ncbi:hypothetical protein YIM73518_23480 [Thermus brockianus]
MVKPKGGAFFSVKDWEAVRQALLRLNEEGLAPHLLLLVEGVKVGPHLSPAWWGGLRELLEALEALGVRVCPVVQYRDPEEGFREVDLEGLLRKVASVGEGVYGESREASMPPLEGQNPVWKGNPRGEVAGLSLNTLPPLAGGGGGRKPPQVSVGALGEGKPDDFFLLLGTLLYGLTSLWEVWRSRKARGRAVAHEEEAWA